ncbi:hypothetical protein N431DRAFT_346193 [Stipitochalara longipes BDJ]|nr:hypothetical protein N431DRAFT_346193 [Stipitochalara longipes BDJ]
MPPKKGKELTTLARVYSHPTGLQHSDLKVGSFLKSGLTPSYLSSFANNKEQKVYNDLMKYQRVRFRGFTTAELHALESLAPFSTIADDPTLTSALCPIHPAFQKDQWKKPLARHQANFPLGNGRPGYWDVGNPVVWKAIEPGARLASKLLSDAHVWGWLDALVAGKVEEIPARDLLKGEKRIFHRFIRRQPHVFGSEKAKNEVAAAVDVACSKMQFHLHSGEIEPHSGLNRELYQVVAETHFPRFKEEAGKDENDIMICENEEGAIVWISFETIEPLLNDRITAAERLLCHFRFGVTLFHEFVHVLFTKVTSYREEFLKEPYCSDELFGELGFEFNQPMTQTTKGLPNGGIFQGPLHEKVIENFVTLADNPVLNITKPRSWQDPTFYPVPVQYFFDLHAQNFWDVYVQKFGGNASHLGPKTVGSRLLGGKGKGKLEPEWEGLGDASPNARRGQIQRIRKAWENGPKAPKNNNNTAEATAADEDTEMEDNTDIDDETFTAILKHLFKHRQELALDSMHFRMGEHVLLAHIIDSGLDLNPNIFRAFLKRCQAEKLYFSWFEINTGPMPTQGLVELLKAGWPQAPLAPRKFNKPTDKVIRLFHKNAKRVMNEEDEDLSYFNQEDQYDFDIECKSRAYPRENY